MAFPPYIFANSGNPALTPPEGPTALGSSLDANFAACSPIVNTTNFPAMSFSAQQVAAVAVSSGAAAVNLSNVNFSALSSAQLLALAQALINSGAAAQAGFLLS